MGFDLNTFNSRLQTLGSVAKIVKGLVGNAAGPTVVYQREVRDRATGATKAIPIEKDWRIRIGLPKESKLFYNRPDESAGILKILQTTDGVIFPYTPQISVTYDAAYDTAQLTHSNYTNFFYKQSSIQAITIAGDFTVQNNNDGLYLLAAVYFFRAASRMFFGQGENIGNPPAILFLNGYGSHYFPNVPCILTNFQHTLPADVDYVVVKQDAMANTKKEIIKDPNDPSDQGYEDTLATPTEITSSAVDVRLPTISQLSITLQPIYSRSFIYNNYNLNDIAAGNLLSPGSPNFL